MDPLERQGIGDPASQAVSDDPIVSEPAKTVDPAQPAQPAVEPASDGDILQTPLSDPGLEAQRKRLLDTERQMIANNTRKTKEREEQHRREMDALTADRQQTAAMMQNLTVQQQGAQKQESGPQGSFDRLPLELKEKSDPNLRVLLGAIDEAASGPMKSVVEQNKALTERLDQLEGTVKQQRDQAVVAHMKPQMEAMKAKYGEALTQDVFAATAKLSLETGLTMDTALYSVSPETVQKHIEAQATARAQQEMQERYGDQAALAGMGDELLGTPPAETFQKGESLEETYARREGLKGLRKALHDED